MLDNYLIHSRSTHLSKVFTKGRTTWYDGNPIWEVYSEDSPHCEEITEDTVVCCSSAATYSAMRNCSAQAFILLEKVEPADGFGIYPIHNGVWLVEPTIPCPVRFLEIPNMPAHMLCFNGSKLGPFLVMRVSADKFGPSDIILLMYNDLSKGQLIHQGKMLSRVLEDPRLFFHMGMIYSTYSVINPYITAVRTSCYLGYSPLTEVSLKIPKYGKNLVKGPEKNWGFFSSGEDLYAIYSYTPWRILKVDGEEASVAYTQEFPKGGPKNIHGGTCPVLHDGKWWVFGRIMDTSFRRDSIICVVFCPTTFRILTWAPVPFFTMEALAHHLFYIGSAEIANGVWTCVGGFNDCSVAEVKFSHADLIKDMPISII